MAPEGMAAYSETLPEIIEGLYCHGPDRIGSTERTFVAADVGNILYVHEGPGFSRAHYEILAVEDGCAVVAHRYAAPDASGGVGTLGNS